VFCAKVGVGLEHTDFVIRRQIIGLFDIRDQIAFENSEKIIYLKCLIKFQEPPLLKVIPILHSSNIVWQNSIELTARFVMEQGISMVEVPLSGKTETDQIA
jgi:hypothetical protein